jgi:hypothetical protein
MENKCPETSTCEHFRVTKCARPYVARAARWNQTQSSCSLKKHQMINFAWHA